MIVIYYSWNEAVVLPASSIDKDTQGTQLNYSPGNTVLTVQYLPNSKAVSFETAFEL
ncbi:hypothetical protein [Pedobacter cryoconitis]|uniref:Uncharacterized protein n=1 Tax=Pedobacter cryoconitis TaxID=188932 RepID=A0A7X0J6B8_9SPHI|nr:hypothetical protein [Pedobacter cryoconitis]MBB6501172.1 hypothetical protein [Pedobacter cryoconitis]